MPRMQNTPQTASAAESLAGTTKVDMDYSAIAAKWRQEQPEPRAMTGVVLIWEGEVYGWKNTLRDAAHEQPGAVAVDPDGNVFKAEGGDAYNGAKCWVAVNGKAL